MNGQAGKGSARRPCLVSREEYEANYERAFGERVQTWWSCPKCGKGVNSKTPCDCERSTTAQ